MLNCLDQTAFRRRIRAVDGVGEIIMHYGAVWEEEFAGGNIIDTNVPFLWTWMALVPIPESSGLSCCPAMNLLEQYIFKYYQERAVP